MTALIIISSLVICLFSLAMFTAMIIMNKYQENPDPKQITVENYWANLSESNKINLPNPGSDPGWYFLVSYRPHEFDLWWNPDKFDWDYSRSLAIHCSKQFSDWFWET